MTQERDEQLLSDLEKIERYVPALPSSYASLRALIAALPTPTLPDIHSARQGTAPDSGLQVSTFGQPASTSPLAGNGIGQDSGGAIGILPQIYYGKVNLLLDPMMRDLGVLTTTAAFVTTGKWQTKHIVNSGALPAAHQLVGQADSVTDVFNPLNTETSELVMSGFVAGDITYIVQDAFGGFQTVDAAPYMLATVRLAKINGFASNFTNITSAIATIELVDGAGTIWATSTPFDWKAWEAASSDGAEVRLTAAYLNTASKVLNWQLRFRVVATGAGGSVEFLFGEPQQVHSATELAPPFSPIIGAWIPQDVIRRAFISTETLIGTWTYGDLFYRFETQSDGLHRWSAGTTTWDVALRRSAAKVLRLDDAAGGRASLEAAAGTGPGSPAAGFGRLYFSSVTKTWHQVDDAGVDTDLAATSGATQVSRDALTTAADYVARIRLTTDTTFRAFLGLDATDRGSLELGPGGVAARDVRLVRSAAGELTVDSNGAAVTSGLVLEATAGQLNSFSAQVAGDTTPRAVLRGDGSITHVAFGPGNAALDTRLRRTAAGELTMDSISAATPTLLRIQATAGQRSVLDVNVAGDTNPRIRLSGDAFLTGIELGPGNAARDVRIQRIAAGAAALDANGAAAASVFQVIAGVGQQSGVNLFVSGDAAARVVINGDATLVGFLLGSGAAARDLRLYRSGAKVLTLDDTAGGAVTLNVVGAIQQGGTAVSVAGHGAADHADITRKLFLNAELATLDAATFANIGASPDLTRVVAYADAATQGAFWNFMVPADWASGVITIQPVWSPGATDAVAHTVRWSYIAKTIPAGSTVTAAGTTVTWTGASAARTVGVVVYDTATSTTLAPAAAGDLFRIEVRRIGADAADTYVGVVNLIGLIVSYTANQ